MVRRLAPLADLYVCDAFAAAHRSQPTLVGFEQVLPSAMGRLFEKEYTIISDILKNPARPCVFVLGGAKIADAFLMMEKVLKEGTADVVLTGGLVANIVAVAKDIDIGKASEDFIYNKNLGECIETAREILDAYSGKILVPEDFAYVEDRYAEQAKFLNTHNIETMEELLAFKTETNSKISESLKSREHLYKARKSALAKAIVVELSDEITSVTKTLKELRKILRTCENIEVDSLALDKKLQGLEQLEVNKTERKLEGPYKKVYQ